jgi:UDPglucose--hexose-1-phosphate uridylyltransferase
MANNLALMLELRREVVESEIFVPVEGGYERRPGRTEVRWDPLTGHSARLITASRFMGPTDFDLEAFAEQTRPTCPFCGEKAERITPRFPETVSREGRIRRGEALCFPNLATFAKWSSVAVYGADRHFLPLGRMTPRLVADVLAAQVAFLVGAGAADPSAVWASISANHMLPSGSSLFHPHVQGALDPYPTTMQRLLADAPSGCFEEYLETEKRLGERFLGSTGRVAWLASFAPVGFHELRALVPGLVSPEQLTADLIEELGLGLGRALNFYAELGMESFNLGIYGAPVGTPGYMLNLRLVSRSNLQPLYRSDATYYERVHWTGLIDGTPEELAQRAGDRFRA